MGTCLFLAIVAAVPAGRAQVSANAQTVEVRRADGSIYAGSIHPTTSAEFLKLKIGWPDCYMIVAVRWGRIESLRVSGKSVVGDQLDAWRNELLGSIRDVEKDTGQPACGATLLPACGEHEPQDALPVGGRPQRESVAVRPDPLPPPVQRRVAGVQVEASAANWDADAELDGLQLVLRPVDHFGRLRPVRGNVTVVLRGVVNHYRWRSGPAGLPRVQTLGRWTRSLRPDQFRAGGARLLLEFGARRPERARAAWHPDWSIGPYGQVHVQLDVPGQGTYRAIANFPVPLRRFSPVGDRLFLTSGSRYR